ncbi:uncharacterized protein PpBr36_11106, partial [Pyricularia pennisetigena]|uniref:uncharacterized protein n=1 Tax=Pyricularia pennisetigena TaxID=1578925 RepID=UPI001152253A
HVGRQWCFGLIAQTRVGVENISEQPICCFFGNRGRLEVEALDCNHSPSPYKNGQNNDLVITIATIDPQTAKKQASNFRPNVIINSSDSGGAAQCYDG